MIWPDMELGHLPSPVGRGATPPLSSASWTVSGNRLQPFIPVFRKHRKSEIPATLSDWVWTWWTCRELEATCRWHLPVDSYTYRAAVMASRHRPWQSSHWNWTPTRRRGASRHHSDTDWSQPQTDACILQRASTAYIRSCKTNSFSIEDRPPTNMIIHHPLWHQLICWCCSRVSCWWLSSSVWRWS